MRAHVFQHVAFEGPGSIGPWLTARGYDVTRTRFFEAADLPDLGEIDLLVVMGGPMSANDEGELHWLVEEKRFARQAVECGKPVLSVCLGAQIIGGAMGARVFPNPAKEIGWFPVRSVGPRGGDVFEFPPSQTVFHWHGETFDLPAGAVRLASSEACENQAFQLGRRAIGLQFHLETTPESAAAIVSCCCEELVPSEYVQTAEEILSAPAERYAAINGLMGGVLSFLTRGES